MRRLLASAVLAAEPVAHEDAKAAHPCGLAASPHVDVAAQADDARHAELGARRAQNALAVELFDEDHAPDDEAHRPRNSHRAERLVGEVEEQNSSVQTCHLGTSFQSFSPLAREVKT